MFWARHRRRTGKKVKWRFQRRLQASLEDLAHIPEGQAAEGSVFRNYPGIGGRHRLDLADASIQPRFET